MAESSRTNSAAPWPDEVEAMQLSKLRTLLTDALVNHPHYRSTFAGLDPAAVDSLDALDDLPLTTKADLAADPDSFRLRTPRGTWHEPWDVVFTSGTTARPTPIHQSAGDFARILFAQRRMAEIRGVTSADRIANLFPLARLPNGSWLRVNDHAFAVGAQLVAGLGGAHTGEFSPTRRLHEVVDVVCDANPTVLWGIPSYVRRFLGACADRGRSLPSVRMVIASGEPTASGVGEAIRDLLSALGSPGAIVSPGFGASELQCSLVPCAPGSGLHNPAPELFLLQTVDSNGATLPSGSTGQLVLSHLDRTGTVLIRYALGDIVTLARDRCPDCGRTGERLLSHEGRVDDRVKIRGQLVDLRGVLDVVSADGAVVEYAVEVRPADPSVERQMDELAIEVALSDAADPDIVTTRITEAVARAVGLTPVIRLVDSEDIFDLERRMKPTRTRMEE